VKPIIAAHDLYYSYSASGPEGREFPVLRGCSFEIFPGEFVAIQGPSGSGKSTLLYLLGCMNKVQKGDLQIFDVDVNQLNPEQTAFFRNRYIGFVFQQFHLLAKTSVLDNILLPSHYPVEARALDFDFKKRAGILLQNLGLAEHAEHLPQQLSGGQQQRVAIARALLNEAPLILADEPTGNLDTQNSQTVMNELRHLQEQGKTVVIITHDKDIAAQADRVISLKDGKVVSGEIFRKAKPTSMISHDVEMQKVQLRMTPWHLLKLLPFAAANLFRNRTRSLLTMVGVSIGVAAVLAMMTLGQFAKAKILSSYAELGINTLNFYGYQGWDQKATDTFGVSFTAFDWDKDLQPLKRVFPEVKLISPVLKTWQSIASYGGKSIDENLGIVGINEDAFLISGQKIARGSPLVPYHIESKSSVCLIGSEIVNRLFKNVDPLGEILKLSEEDRSFGCRIIGVMAPRQTRSQWRDPNLEVYVPYTFYQAASGSWWAAQIHEVLIQLHAGAPVERTGKAIRAFFERKYGKSGEFRVDADSMLIAQMGKFLSIFSGFLAAVALISLGVGGVGIANMMMVSVSERYREIGLRKALGATDKSIRMQFLLEAVLLCGLAGLIGIVFGFGGYELIIWAATKLIPKLQFEWIINWVALLFSLISILLVGVFSGLVPAIRAEKLSPIQALRSE